MRDRLTIDKTKIFVRENPTLMSITKDELRKLYNEVFDRLQEYEVAEEQGQIIVPPCKVYEDVYLIVNGIIERCSVDGIHYTRRKKYVRLRPHHQDYWGNWSKYYTPSLRSFGKTIFITREEAKQALRGDG